MRCRIWVVWCVIGAALLSLTAAALADEIPLAADYETTLARSRVIDASSAFGDSTNLYDGSTTFSVTPVSIPGSNQLPVSVTYVLRAYDKEFRGSFKFKAETPYLSGVYKTGQGWVIAGSNPTARCSFPGGMPQPPEVTNTSGKPETFFTEEYWHGIYLNLPVASPQLLQLVNAGDTQVPSDGAAYKWATQDRWYFSCINNIAGGGEGFVGHSPDGLRYYFDVSGATGAWDSVRKAAQLGGTTVLQRTELTLRASRVEDAYGNWVAYQYSSGELVGVTSSDGRSIQLSAGKITANGRTWAIDATNGLSIGYPDGSSYVATVVNNIQWTSWDLVACGSTAPMKNFSGSLGVNIKLPSGAVGDFLLTPVVTGQSSVPLLCAAPPATGPAGPHAFRRGLGLTQKAVSGGGLSNARWTFNYGANGCFVNVGGGGTNRAPCAANESGTRLVTVTGPTATRRLTFSNKFQADDGQLLAEEIRSLAGQLLRTTQFTYQRFGAVGNLGFAAGGDPTGYARSWVKSTKTIDQDSVRYETAVTQFDGFFRPVRLLRRSTPGASRTDQFTYFDDFSRWHIGQPSTATNVDTGLVESRVDYDANGLPWKTWKFGILSQTLTYDSSATLATVADGNGNVTQYSDWYRGVPRRVRFADGATRSATVDDNGWISSLTDENNYTRSMQYDLVGRLRDVAYPASNGQVWNSWTSVFRPLVSSDSRPSGIGDGQWIKVESQGTYRKVSYFDAYWRPLVVNEYDSGNVAGTSRSTSYQYDTEGRVVFSSYPVSGNVGGDAGLRSTYDALGRIVLVSEDSELGRLETVTTFGGEGGYNTIVRNPRGSETRTWYQTFEEPSAGHATLVEAPEGQSTEISRDVFGKPLSIKRKDQVSSVALTRSYVYDAAQRLCKSVEPETGATVLAYDNAGNLSWLAGGLALISPSSCDSAAASASSEVVRRTYDARNRIRSISFPKGRGDQLFSYLADGKVKQISTQNDGIASYNSYAYNSRGLLVGEAQAQADGETLTMRHAYDANGNLSADTYPTGETIAYEPNALGQSTRAGMYATGVAYFPDGAIRQFTYGNGITHTVIQNARQLADTVQDSYGGSALFSEGYDYDGSANIVAITDGASGRGQRGNRTMEYDGRDRLISAVSPMFGAAQYGYDAFDNLTRVAVAGRDQYYCYDGNWLLSNIKLGGCNGTTVVGLGYDSRGNLINKNGRLYDFDAGNRLRGIEDLEEYRYDGKGLRNVVRRDAGVIASMYDVGEVLRFRRDGQRAIDTSYISLGSQAVAEVDRPWGQQSTVREQLSWAPVSGASRYLVEESVDGVTWTVVYEGVDAAWQSLGRPSATYSYRVSACPSGGECQAVTAVTHTQVPAIDIVLLLYQILLN